MGTLPSREKPLGVPPAAAGPTQPTSAGECHGWRPSAGLCRAQGALSPLSFPAAPSSFLALCDFPSGAGAAAVLRMGERLRVLSEWLYEGVSRQKAEELLLQPGNHSGSFLIRESQTRRGCYSLSVRRGERGPWASVTHYRIQRLGNGWLYIAPRLTFPSLHRLVEHYSELGEGLCCALREPCSGGQARPAPAPAPPAVVKLPSLNWDEIGSSLLCSETESPPEDSPISLGLREAVSSYLLLTDTATPEQGAKKS
ncbi:src-like-adapter 2 isoform X3 [Colius striatus]|uniref:src-like-adapter 2 isoform X3 n=1 Tax=Colius striatus TaxID=57412 RepID=UPI002B1D6EF5|nr:src-like-adapter 2 isoform X3 [Colius striatus]